LFFHWTWPAPVSPPRRRSERNRSPRPQARRLAGTGAKSSSEFRARGRGPPMKKDADNRRRNSGPPTRETFKIPPNEETASPTQRGKLDQPPRKRCNPLKRGAARTLQRRVCRPKGGTSFSRSSKPDHERNLLDSTEHRPLLFSWTRISTCGGFNHPGGRISSSFIPGGRGGGPIHPPWSRDLRLPDAGGLTYAKCCGTTILDGTTGRPTRGWPLVFKRCASCPTRTLGRTGLTGVVITFAEHHGGQEASRAKELRAKQRPPVPTPPRRSEGSEKRGK